MFGRPPLEYTGAYRDLLMDNKLKKAEEKHFNIENTFLPGYEPNSSGNKHKQKQALLHLIIKLLHIKRSTPIIS